MIVDALIPALNEEQALPLVLGDLRGQAGLRSVLVVDNGSTDGTAAAARAAGALVIREPRRGYGAACLAGLRFLAAQRPPPDVVVFLDGDRSDDVGDLPRLLQPLLRGEADLVVGSRSRGADPGALQPAQRAGNAVAVLLLRLLYGQRVTDLGPFRAARLAALQALQMEDRDYGWIAEMQVKAARQGLRLVEVPVRYHRRAAGRSKVSATVRGTFGAGYKILGTILRYAVFSA